MSQAGSQMQTRALESSKLETKSLAPTTHTTATNRSVSGKLNAMADDFNNFFGDLEEETTIRKQSEE